MCVAVAVRGGCVPFSNLVSLLWQRSALQPPSLLSSKQRLLRATDCKQPMLPWTWVRCAGGRPQVRYDARRLATLAATRAKPVNSMLLNDVTLAAPSIKASTSQCRRRHKRVQVVVLREGNLRQEAVDALLAVSRCARGEVTRSWPTF